MVAVSSKAFFDKEETCSSTTYVCKPMVAWNWCHITCDLESFYALYLITSHGNDTPVFPFKCTYSIISCFCKCPFFSPLEHVWVESAFVIFFFCCLHLSIFASEAPNLLPNSQLFIFSAWLISIGMWLCLILFWIEVALVDHFSMWSTILLV